MKRFLTTVAKISLGAVLAFAVWEIAARIFPVCTLPITSGKSTEYVAKPILPNQSTVYSRGWLFQIGNRVEINADGFHSGTDYERCADGNAAAFVGDSMIENIMVDSAHLLHPVLQGKFKAASAEVPVYSFGNSGAGMGDIVNFMRLASEKYNIGNFIIKFDYRDILDDVHQNDGHFCYVLENGAASIKLFPKNTGFEKFKSVAVLRYLFSNIQILPSSFAKKFRAALGLKESVGASNAAVVEKLSPTEEKLFDAFLSDALEIVKSDPKRILFLVRGDEMKKSICEKLAARGFEVVDVDAATECKSEADLSHFHNDSHWNARGIERVCLAVAKTEFFAEIARRGANKNAH